MRVRRACEHTPGQGETHINWPRTSQSFGIGIGWNANRRRFLHLASSSFVALLGASASACSADLVPGGLPRWRGFNLLELFDAQSGAKQFQASDFDMIAEWGFNFVRLPCSYWFWAKPDPKVWLNIDDKILSSTVDTAIEMGRSRDIHVNLCLHRVPGYCVSPPVEPLDIWKDKRALDAAAYHWEYLARRYRNIPSASLSFNLLNEPPNTITVEQYLTVHRRLHEAIRKADAHRLVIVDGMAFATQPVDALSGENVAISMHAYNPLELSHYCAPWVQGDSEWPVPTWPLKIKSVGNDGQEYDDLWDRARIEREEIVPFTELQNRGVGVHVGEWGAYRLTPHDVALRWMSDRLDLWRKVGWGWALWNLRGGFGVLDSSRRDVSYEKFRGHLLDRKMLELLRAG
jgi:endoglucanase